MDLPQFNFLVRVSCLCENQSIFRDSYKKYVFHSSRKTWNTHPKSESRKIIAERLSLVSAMNKIWTCGNIRTDTNPRLLNLMAWSLKSMNLVHHFYDLQSLVEIILQTEWLVLKYLRVRRRKEHVYDRNLPTKSNVVSFRELSCCLYTRTVNSTCRLFMKTYVFVL